MGLRRIVLRMLDGSGATDGQAPLWSDAANAYVPGDVSSGGGSGLSLDWIDVTDPTYGATGDGTTDDSTAIQAAFDAVPTTGGTVYFPPGQYNCSTTALTIDNPTLVRGSSVGWYPGVDSSCQIISSSSIGQLITVNGNGSKFRDIDLLCTATTPTAGAGIYVAAGDVARYDNVNIYGFWINLHIEGGDSWAMDRCVMHSPKKYSVLVRNTASPDNGDAAITNCTFSTDRAADAAIRYESGGGLKFTANKINGASGTNKYAYGIDATITGTTGVMTVIGNSIENVTTAGIRGQESGGSFQQVTISVNQFGFYTSGAQSAVDITGWNDVTVVGNVGIGTSSAAMVKFASVTNGAVGLNSARGFAAEYTLTSSTSITTLSASGVPTTRTLTAGTGLTGGGDMTADRTFAIDITAELERIQDAVGAMVVAGANVTAAYDDSAGTLTLAASGGSGTEIAVVDGITNPPELAYNDAGDDYVYMD